MTWNYRVLKEQVLIHKQTYDSFKVISVYYDEDGKITSWSDTSDNTLVWEDYADLEGTVNLLPHAFKKPILQLQDDYLVPLSEEAELSTSKDFYVVEYRDHENNCSPAYYASAWDKAVKWIVAQDNAQYKDDFYYAITTQHMDKEANDLSEAVLFDKDGQPL